MRIVFMGSPEFAIPSLRILIESPWEVVCVFSQPDRPVGRRQVLTSTPVKQFALENDIQVDTPETLRSPAVVDRLRSLEPDVIVVVAYGLKIPAEILELPPQGCVNVHPSLLPRYRGACPIQWTLINGDTRTGVTTIRMDEGWDTGGMLLQRAVEIHPWETYGDLWPRLALLGAEVLYDTLEGLGQEIVPIPQNDEEAVLAPFLREKDIVLDWTQPSESLAHRIRGLSPDPGAVTLWRGTRLKVYLAEPAEVAGPYLPGEIVKASPKEGLLVGTGDGALELKEVQIPGKRSMPATDFINGNRPEVGEILGGDHP